MDWSKAKNILIVAFIVTNLFLLFNIEQNILRQENFLTVSNKYISEVKEHLRNAGIKVDTEIPVDTLAMPLLFVKYNMINPEEVVTKLIGDYIKIDPNTYISNVGIVKITGGKKLLFKRLQRSTPDYSMDEKKATLIGEEFLIDYLSDYNRIQLSQIYYGMTEFDDNPVYKLVYEQLYKDHFLGESYINVYVNKYGVVGLEAMLLEYDSKVYTQKKKIIPATEALLRKINTIVTDHNYDEVVINSISLGYYFDPQSVSVANWHDIESGTALPSWRITLKNGRTYYVEAFKN